MQGREFREIIERSPVIAGGLIYDRQDVVDALDAGAIAISASSPDVWDM